MVQYPMQRIAVTAGFSIYNPFATNPSMHYAIDISRTQPVTFNVFAANDGNVVMSLYDSAGGNMIAIQGYYSDKKDIITRYAHLSIRSVFRGDTVTRGQVIGVQGNTGTATTGQHLHFETWLVPKNYTYSFSDRARYAIDPLCICQLLEDQEFLKDAETFNYDAMPYPDPAVELNMIENGKVTIVGEVPMYLLPSTKYSPQVSGYNRSKKYITDYFYDTVFDAYRTSNNDGDKWALITTARGDQWVPILDGKSILTGKEEGGTDPGSPECEEEVGKLRTELQTYKDAVTELNEIISKL